MWGALYGRVDMGFKPKIYNSMRGDKLVKFICNEKDVDDPIFGDDYHKHSTK